MSPSSLIPHTLPNYILCTGFYTAALQRLGLKHFGHLYPSSFQSEPRSSFTVVASVFYKISPFLDSSLVHLIPKKRHHLNTYKIIVTLYV